MEKAGNIKMDAARGQMVNRHVTQGVRHENGIFGKLLLPEAKVQ